MAEVTDNCTRCGRPPEAHTNPLRHVEIEGEMYHGYCAEKSEREHNQLKPENPQTNRYY